MAASISDNKLSIAAELVSLINRVEFTGTVKALKESDVVPVEEFNTLDIANWYEMDTTKCFIGKRKFKFNPHCVYDIFADYCNKTKFEVKDLVRKELTENMPWYKKGKRF